MNRGIPTGVSIALAVLVAACAASSATPAPSSPPAATPAPSTATLAPPTDAPSPTPGQATRIALSGGGPIGLDVAAGRAWVGLVDSGHLNEVDLESGKELRSIEVGFGASHVAIGADAVYASRIDAGDGDPLVIVDPRTGQRSRCRCP